MTLKFEWNPEKADRNLKKHRVLFSEAATVFGDRLSVTFCDPDHSTEEERFVTVGTAQTGRLLVVAHTDRKGRIRIISAREMTRSERWYYEEKQD